MDELRLHLAEAREALRAIRNGEVDVVVVEGKDGNQLFTLDGAEQAYRVLIESMNEGALTLTADKTILYANACFAKMVQLPLEQVTGGSFRRFLSLTDRALLKQLLGNVEKSGNKIQVQLKAEDGSRLAVQISLHYLEHGISEGNTVSMVVTDMSEAHRTQELLRTLMQRVVQAQEAERGRVALELHDTVTQMLCGVLIHSQLLLNTLAPDDHKARAETDILNTELGKTINEVERISRNLRPSVLDHLGLVALLRETGNEFSERTGIAVTLACVVLSTRLPADAELALFRILQESLKNIEKHAKAHNVSIFLTKQGKSIQLTIQDDGIGFDPDVQPRQSNGKRGMGVIGMRERAVHVGGNLKVASLSTGTNIEVRIPLQTIRRSSTRPASALPVLRTELSPRSRPVALRVLPRPKKADRIEPPLKGAAPEIRNT